MQVPTNAFLFVLLHKSFMQLHPATLVGRSGLKGGGGGGGGGVQPLT